MYKNLEILGEPKTVRLAMKHRGLMHAAPLEVWLSAMVATMTPEQKEVLFRVVDQFNAQLESIQGKARVVAEIPMPAIGG